MNKFVVSLFVFTILLVSTGNVLALDFDNVKEYNKTSKTVTITNAFGLGDTIAEIKLTSALENHVPLGYGKVAEMEFNTSEDFKSFIDDIELFNIKDNNKKFLRQLDFKFKTVINVQGNEYKDIWTDISKLKFKSNEIITIGIFTDVQKGDKVEWIPTYFGREIDEWAIWEYTGVSYTAGDIYPKGIVFQGNNWWLIGSAGEKVRKYFANWTYTNVNYDISAQTVAGADIFFDDTNWWLLSPTIMYKYFANWTYIPNENISISAQENSADGFFANNTNWFITGSQNAHVYIYFINGTYTNVNHDISAQDNLPQGIYFDNTNWWMVGAQNAHVYKYFANWTYTNVNYDVSTQDNDPEDLWIKDIEWWIVGNENNKVYLYEGINITLFSPENASSILSSDINFIGYAEGTVNNVSLIINNVYNETNSTGVDNVNYTFIKDVAIGNYTWLYEICYSLHCANSSIRHFSIINFTTNSITHNSTTYETAKENYIINISSNGLQTVTATFNYNGTVYDTTKTGDNTEMLFTSTVPTFVENYTGNNSFFWNISYGGYYDSTATYFQYVNDLNFQQCNGTGYPFLNFTFKDEEDDTFIDARLATTDLQYWLGDGTQKKNLTFSSIPSYQSYDFCLNVNYTLHHDGDFEYKNTSYPQKTYASEGDLTNDTTKTILYLLNEDDGIDTTIQVVDNQGDVLLDVEVTVEKLVSGVWTVVALDNTDSAGLVTFWVNPDDDYKFTFVKADCIGTTSTIRPTQTTYTQQLSCGAETEIYISPLQGIIYSRTPAEGIIPSEVSTNFTYQIVSSRNNIINASMRIIFVNGTEVNSTWSSCSASGCTMFVTYTPSYGANMKGMYYVDIGNGSILLEGDSRWRTIDIDVGNSGGISSAFRDFRRAINDWSTTDDTSDYNRLVIAFFLLAMVICALNYATGMDSLSPGLFLTIITGLVFLGSISDGAFGQGFFYYNNLSGIDFINNYILVMLLSSLTLAQYVSIWRRTQR